MKTFNIEFEETLIPLFTDTSGSQLQPYFSNYKVPVLEDGGLLVWDSLAIMEYISEHYLDGKGWPVDVKARAMARSVSAEMHSSFMDLRNTLHMNCRLKLDSFSYSPEVENDIGRIKAIWNRCRSLYANDGDWLFGSYSIADAMYAPVVLRFNSYGVLLNDLEADYCHTVLQSEPVIDWMSSGQQETAVIKQNEVNQ